MMAGLGAPEGGHVFACANSRRSSPITPAAPAGWIASRASFRNRLRPRPRRRGSAALLPPGCVGNANAAPLPLGPAVNASCRRACDRAPENVAPCSPLRAGTFRSWAIGVVAREAAVPHMRSARANRAHRIRASEFRGCGLFRQLGSPPSRPSSCLNRSHPT